MAKHLVTRGTRSKSSAEIKAALQDFPRGTLIWHYASALHWQPNTLPAPIDTSTRTRIRTAVPYRHTLKGAAMTRSQILTDNWLLLISLQWSLSNIFSKTLTSFLLFCLLFLLFPRDVISFLTVCDGNRVDTIISDVQLKWQYSQCTTGILYSAQYILYVANVFNYILYIKKVISMEIFILNNPSTSWIKLNFGLNFWL